MPIPSSQRYDRIAERFADVRPWAAAAFGQYNRCTICVSFALRLTPKGNEASLADLAGSQAAIAKAPPLRGAPFGDVAPQIFIRAAELLPAVQRVFGAADVEGVASSVWPGIVGKRGVLYIENCYPTERNKFWTIKGIFEPTTGDHWDLFDGLRMVSAEEGLRNNSHAGKLWFWKAA